MRAMRLLVLGARQGESRDSHFAAFLVDDVLALDAGGLTSTTTLAQQARIRALLLTHGHYDHVRDLGSLGYNLFGRGQILVYCTSEVRAKVEATLLKDDFWINFFRMPTPEEPTFGHVDVSPGQPFEALGYRVQPVLVPHSVPTLGYLVAGPAGPGAGTLLYTGDNGPGAGSAWAAVAPDLLVTEVTYPDAQAELAAQFGHLSPRLLGEELRAFRALRGYLPRVLAVHVNPYHERQIADELSFVAADLAADVAMAEEGSSVDVVPVAR